jgi:hypothetical protein
VLIGLLPYSTGSRLSHRRALRDAGSLHGLDLGEAERFAEPWKRVGGVTAGGLGRAERRASTQAGCQILIAREWSPAVNPTAKTGSTPAC